MKIFFSFLLGLLAASAVFLSFERLDDHGVGDTKIDDGNRRGLALADDVVAKLPQTPRAGRAVQKSRRQSKSKLDDLKRQVGGLDLGSKDPMALRLQLAYEYAVVDPDAGFEWIQSLDQSGPDVKMLASAFAAKLGGIGSDRWKDYLPQLSKGSIRDHIIWGAISGLGGADVKKAWEEYQSIADSAWNREYTDAMVSNRLAQKNPEKFWEIVQEVKQDSKKGLEIEADFFRNAIFEDKAVAVGILEMVEDLDLRSQYLESYMNGLYPEHLVDFGQAINAGGFERAEKDQILLALGARAYDRDLTGGAKMVSSIQDQALKRDLVLQIKLYAQTQGPEIETKVNQILGGEGS